MIIPALAAAALVLWILLGLVWTETDERTTAELARLLGYLGLITLVLTGLNRRTFRAAAAGATAVAAWDRRAGAGQPALPRLLPGRDRGRPRLPGRSTRLPARLLERGRRLGGDGGGGRPRLERPRAPAPDPRAQPRRCPGRRHRRLPTYSRGGAIGSTAGVLAVLALSRNRWTALFHTLVAASATAAAILVVRSHGQIADATGGAGGGDVLAVLLIGGLACAGVVAFSDSLHLDRMRLPRPSMRFAAAAALAAVLVAVAAAAPLSRGVGRVPQRSSRPAGAVTRRPA